MHQCVNNQNFNYLTYTYKFTFSYYLFTFRIANLLCIYSMIIYAWGQPLRLLPNHGTRVVIMNIVQTCLLTWGVSTNMARFLDIKLWWCQSSIFCQWRSQWKCFTLTLSPLQLLYSILLSIIPGHFTCQWEMKYKQLILRAFTVSCHPTITKKICSNWIKVF